MIKRVRRARLFCPLARSLDEAPLGALTRSPMVKMVKMDKISKGPSAAALLLLPPLSTDKGSGGRGGAAEGHFLLSRPC